jgi:transposase
MMSKGTFFTGQPIFNQILNYIPRTIIQSAARETNADYRYKSFKTYEHLVTMLYSLFNHCNSLREVTTGLLAWDHPIKHLGIDAHPRRSTLADANKNRHHEVFEKIYLKLLDRYKAFLPDSRQRSCKNNLYIFDSTTITLFQEILKTVGHSKADGRRKGGIKVHTLLHAATDVPTMVRYSAAAATDIQFLKLVKLPAGSVVVFDKGYRHYASYNLLTRQQITWVTRHRDSSAYKILKINPVNDFQKQKGITSDHSILLGRPGQYNVETVQARMVSYRDPVTKKFFRFITNDFDLAPLTIANYYRKRWQIETFFKRIKQNYPLQYFLGDSENAIKIQIWCALIADLLLKVIKKGTRSTMSFSNINSLVRIHLMTYMDLTSFLRSPQKSLLRKMKQQKKDNDAPSLFAT